MLNKLRVNDKFISRFESLSGEYSFWVSTLQFKVLGEFKKGDTLKILNIRGGASMLEIKVKVVEDSSIKHSLVPINLVGLDPEVTEVDHEDLLVMLSDVSSGNRLFLLIIKLEEGTTSKISILLGDTGNTMEYTIR